jgi:signal transduction histidine kinase
MPDAPWLAAVLEGDRRGLLLRLVGGGALIITGIIGATAVLSGASDVGALANSMLFAVLAVAGVGLALAPLLWRVFAQLRAESEGRIREQERAEVAAMIHDKVLHTLALIQRNSADPKTVLRLARGQERELRGWLYKPSGSPAEKFAAALEEAAAEVEDTYAIVVEVVVVGDRDVDDRVGALVAAAREAMVNAARHAKVSTVSLYAEVEPDLTSVFVRDRGVGFDPSTVDDDRHGVRGSIVGRMKRHGGRSEIRSEPGTGTEVRLYLPSQVESRRGGWFSGGEGTAENAGEGTGRTAGETVVAVEEKDGSHD